jgi:protein crumbs
MKSDLKSMFTAMAFVLASPVLVADESSGDEDFVPPQPGSYYGWGPGMMHGPGYSPGYGMGPGMMHGPGYGPGYGMGPGMMYGPGYGPGYGMGPGMMHRPGYGMGPGMMYGPGYGQTPDSDDDDNRPYWGPGMMHGPRYGGRR